MSNNGWLASKPCKKYEPIPEKEGCCHNKFMRPEKEGCCCSKSMYKALELLFDPSIKDAVLDDRFAFIGKKFLVGTPLELVPPNGSLATIGNDNTGAPMATLNSIDPCNHEYISITSSGYYYPTPYEAGSPANPYFIPNPVSNVSLCNLDAIIFDYNPSGPIGANFISNLQKLIDSKYTCHNFKNDECCCGNSVYKDIYTPYSFNGNLVNINAGWLALYQAKVLGRVGDILVLANSRSDRHRIYFVCLESVEFYGRETYI